MTSTMPDAPSFAAPSKRTCSNSCRRYRRRRRRTRMRSRHTPSCHPRRPTTTCARTRSWRPSPATRTSDLRTGPTCRSPSSRRAPRRIRCSTICARPACSRRFASSEIRRCRSGPWRSCVSREARRSCLSPLDWNPRDCGTPAFETSGSMPRDATLSARRGTRTGRCACARADARRPPRRTSNRRCTHSTSTCISRASPRL